MTTSRTASVVRCSIGFGVTIRCHDKSVDGPYRTVRFCCRLWYRTKAKSIVQPIHVKMPAALIEQEEESKLQLERLHLALGQLSERERQVLSLRFVDGFKFEQIARELDSSNSRAAQIAWGAIHRLRAVMAGQKLPPKSIYKKRDVKGGLCDG